jgi:hypothetical protein
MSDEKVSDGVDFSKSLLGRLLVAGTAGIGIAGLVFLTALLVAGLLRLLRDAVVLLAANNGAVVADVMGWRWDQILPVLALWVACSAWVYYKAYLK